ncbi:hypothetical protein N7488_001831 [Penicillium malachiteum]|nr:hypothetical protein N7488_001831 [Penicillium malachiteum]
MEEIKRFEGQKCRKIMKEFPCTMDTPRKKRRCRGPSAQFFLACGVYCGTLGYCDFPAKGTMLLHVLSSYGLIEVLKTILGDSQH